MRASLRLVPLAVLVLSSCIVRVSKVEVEPHSLPLQTRVFRSPVKVHLLDGSTIIFAKGVEIGSTELVGSGERFDLLLRPQGHSPRVPLDSVGAIESFREGTNGTASVVASLLGTAALAGAAAFIHALFNCPGDCRRHTCED